WLASLAHERRASPKTIEAYGRDLRQFLGFLGSAYLADGAMLARLTAADIRGFLGERREAGIGNRSLARQIAAPRSAARANGCRCPLRASRPGNRGYRRRSAARAWRRRRDRQSPESPGIGADRVHRPRSSWARRAAHAREKRASSREAGEPGFAAASRSIDLRSSRAPPGAKRICRKKANDELWSVRDAIR